MKSNFVILGCCKITWLTKFTPEGLLYGTGGDFYISLPPYQAALIFLPQ
jgi:hypothetical protein